MKTLAAFAVAALAFSTPFGEASAQGDPPLAGPMLTPPPPPALAAAQYFYIDNGRQAGPFSAEEVRQQIAAGLIMAATFVWKSGTPTWVAASDLPEFATAFAGPPGRPSVARVVEDLSLDALSWKTGAAIITIPHVAIKGSSLSKSQVQTLFSEAWSLSTVGLLAKFDATSISIPEVQFDSAAPGADLRDLPAKTHAVYRDLYLDDIKAGKAARISMTGLGWRVSGPAPVNVTTGPFRATDYDVASAVRFAFATAAPGEAPEQITGPAAIESVHVVLPQGVELSIGRLALGVIRLRPLAIPAASLAQTTLAVGGGYQLLGPAEAARMIDALADFCSALALDSISISDISLKTPDRWFPGFSLKAIKLGPIANSNFAELGIEGLELNREGGRVRLDRLALLGLDLKPVVSAAAAVAKTGDFGPAVMGRIDWHGAVPRLDGFVVQGVDVLVPAPTPKPLKLVGFELELGNYVGGIPTALRAQLDNFTAESSLFREIGGLMTFGYKDVGLSSSVDLAWNESSKAILINEASAKAAGMGSLSLTAALGNVPRELFAGTWPQMQVGGLGVRLNELSVRLDDAGIFGRIVAQIARDQGMSPDALRTQWGIQAQLELPQLLGGSDQAKLLASAVATFIVNPKSLAIAVNAKGSGLGLSDVMFGGRPNLAAIFGKLDVAASANE